MRYLRADKSLDFKLSIPPENNPSAEVSPWYEDYLIPPKQVIVFGHWAALDGRDAKPNILNLDAGCGWQKKLAMLDIDRGIKWSYDFALDQVSHEDFRIQA